MKSLSFFFVLILSVGVSAATSTKKQTRSNATASSASVNVPSQRATSGFALSRVTPKLALMSSNFDGDYAANDSRNGIHVSALGELSTPVSGLALESGLVYEQMGGSNKIEIQNETTSSGIRLNYLKLPAYAKYYLPMTTQTKVFIKGGPSIGYMVSKTEFLEAKGTNKEEEVKDEDVNRVQFAAELGAGVFIPVGENDILVEWGYTRGLNRANAKGSQSSYNNAFNLGIGMSFNL